MPERARQVPEALNTKRRCKTLCWSLKLGFPVSQCCLCPLEAALGAGTLTRPWHMPIMWLSAGGGAPGTS